MSWIERTTTDRDRQGDRGSKRKKENKEIKNEENKEQEKENERMEITESIVRQRWREAVRHTHR